MEDITKKLKELVRSRKNQKVTYKRSEIKDVSRLAHLLRKGH